MRASLVAVVLLDGATSDDELREFLAQKFAKWQFPDALVFVKTLAKGRSTFRYHRRFTDLVCASRGFAVGESVHTEGRT
jgi:acyl-CoA synthetase (AMP-forming)/AMP-acid ligase II